MISENVFLHVTKRMGSTNLNYVVILVILYKFHRPGRFVIISSRYACWEGPNQKYGVADLISLVRNSDFYCAVQG